MRHYGGFYAVLVWASLASPLRAAEKSDQVKAKADYADAAEQCEKAIDLRRQDLISDYSKDVFSLKERFQREGNLEKALAADEEWSRSLDQKTVIGKTPIAFPAELVAVQNDYVSRLHTLPKTVAEEILGTLRREASLLAKAGDLTQGRVLDSEIKTIERLYLDGESRKEPSDTEGDAVEICEAMIRQQRLALQSQYVAELEAREKSCQAQGLLEELFATKAERERYIKSPDNLGEHLVESPLAVLELQQKYVDLHDSLVERTASDMLEKLAQQKKSLTIAGRLEDAIAKKQQEDAVRARYFTVPQQAKGQRVVLLKQKDWELLPAGNRCRGTWVFADKEIRGTSTSMVTGPIEDWTVITCKRAFREYVVKCRVRMDKGNQADAAFCLAFGSIDGWCMKPELNKWSDVELMIRGKSARFSVNGRVSQESEVDYDASHVQIKIHTASVTIRDFRVEVLAE